MKKEKRGEERRSGGEQGNDSEVKDIIWTKTQKRDGKGGHERRYWELTTKRQYKKNKKDKDSEILSCVFVLFILEGFILKFTIYLTSL